MRTALIFVVLSAVGCGAAAPRQYRGGTGQPTYLFQIAQAAPDPGAIGHIEERFLATAHGNRLDVIELERDWYQMAAAVDAILTHDLGRGPEVDVIRDLITLHPPVRQIGQVTVPAERGQVVAIAGCPWTDQENEVLGCASDAEPRTQTTFAVGTDRGWVLLVGVDGTRHRELDTGAPIDALAFDGTGTQLLVVSRGRGTIWDPRAGRKLRDVPAEPLSGPVIVSGKGNFFLAAGRGGLWAFDTEAQRLVLDERPTTFDRHGTGVDRPLCFFAYVNHQQLWSVHLSGERELYVQSVMTPRREPELARVRGRKLQVAACGPPGLLGMQEDDTPVVKSRNHPGYEGRGDHVRPSPRWLMIGGGRLYAAVGGHGRIYLATSASIRDAESNATAGARAAETADARRRAAQDDHAARQAAEQDRARQRMSNPAVFGEDLEENYRRQQEGDDDPNLAVRVLLGMVARFQGGADGKMRPPDFEAQYDADHDGAYDMDEFLAYQRAKLAKGPK